MDAERTPTTDQGKWLLAHQGLINIGRVDGSMRGDEIDLAASIVTIEREAAAAPAVTETDLRAALDVERLALALDAPGVFEDPLDDPVGLARDIAREYAALAGTTDTEEEEA